MRTQMSAGGSELTSIFCLALTGLATEMVCEGCVFSVLTSVAADLASEGFSKFAQPASAKLIHFGGGQTQTTLELEPGTHTLQLVLGDKNHIPHNPPVVSEKITIMVK